METETIEAPTEITRDSLLEAAQQADNETVEDETQSAKAETPERAAGEEKPTPEVKTGDTPESSEPKPELEKETRERDPLTGRFKPKAEEKPSAEVKPETPYSKAQKEQERQKSVLANFESEKQRVRAEQERKEQELQQREVQLRQAAQAQRPEATKDGYTAREYYEAAQEFAKAGDHEAAYKALVTAQEVRNYEAKYFQQAGQQQRLQQFSQAFNTDMDKVIKENKDLEDGTTPISQAVQAILSENPDIFYMPNGFSRAHEIAKLRLDAGSVSELRKQLEQTQAELAEARKATQPARGGSSSPKSPKEFNQMTQEEQRDYLIRQSEEADLAA